MKEKKREISLYSLYDFAGIARHLEEMARRGWQLEKIGGTLWRYRRTEPADIRYAAVCFANATELDVEPSQKQRDFWEMCQATGWQLVANRAQLQIFCNPDAHAVPIETDPVVQVDNIHAGMKKGLLLSHLIVMICALIALFSDFRTSDTIRDFFSDPFSMGAVLIWGALAVHCGWEMVHYLRWHRKAKAAAQEEGILFAPKSQKWRQVLLLTICAVYILFLLVSALGGSSSTTIFALLYGVVYAAVLTGSVRGSQWLMKKKGVSPTTNRVLSCVIGVAASMLLLFCMVKLVMSDHSTLQLQGHTNAETVTYTSADGSRTYTYDFYRDDLPLTVEDLLDTEPDSEYSRRLNVSSTPFLTEYAVTQRIPYYGDTDKPDLSYTVWEVGFDFLYEPVKESFFKADEYRIHGVTFSFDCEWCGIDAAPWGAAEAYQYYRDGEPYSTWLLCYADRFVEIHFDGWDGASPTPEQMALIGDTLGCGAW